MSATITISDEAYKKLQNAAQAKGVEKVEEFLDEWKELELASRRRAR